MSSVKLYIGTPNSSSWSLRAWLMLKQTAIKFEAVVIELDKPDTQKNILKISPAGKVPILNYQGDLIWDSLAIAEFLAETFPVQQLWPIDKSLRAKARSISCEMHSGFVALRKAMPFNANARFENYVIPADAQEDINRIIQIWEECRKLSFDKGIFLFGNFTIADAMFAPVVCRFVTYGVKLPKIAEEYVSTVLQWPAMQEWYQFAAEMRVQEQNKK